MTHAHTDAPIAKASFRPWTERMFQIGAGLAIIGIILIEVSNMVGSYEAGIGMRLASMVLALGSGVVLGIWAARRPEASGKRSGAFALTAAIISLVAAGAAFVIGQIIQAAMRIPAAGTFVILTIALAVLGLVALVAGIIKRINA